MAAVIQVSSGGDQALKPGGATIEVLLKPSGGVTSAGEGPGGGSQTLWCPSLRVLGAGLRSVGDTHTHTHTPGTTASRAHQRRGCTLPMCCLYMELQK